MQIKYIVVRNNKVLFRGGKGTLGVLRRFAAKQNATVISLDSKRAV